MAKPLFSQELASWGNGSTDEYLAGQVTELVAAIKETCMKGSIQIVVSFDPEVEDGPDGTRVVAAIDVQPAIKVTVPRPTQSVNRRYPNEADELERVDPRIPDMFPEDVH